MNFRATLLLALLSATPAAAQTRIVVPITQTLLPDGDIRYSVPIRVGNSDPIQALLDTGSTGLRILPNAIPTDTYSDTGFSSAYAYGSGERLAGTIATGPVGIGAATTDNAVPLEIVNAVGCMDFQPSCNAAKLPLASYGIGGDGIAGQGFQAILGISLAPATGSGFTENPLLHIGARRWIITLPEPGDPEPGALILNPDDSELQNYQMFQLAPLAGGGAGQDAGWNDTLPACLRNTTTAQSICGPALLDTGAPGIIAYQSPTTSPAPLWSPGDNILLTFSAGGGGPATTFTADRYPGSGLLTEPPNGNISFVAGMLPFYAYSVLYDANMGLIGLHPRANVPDFSNAPASTSVEPDTQIEVIKMNAPNTSTTSAPGIQLPQVITPTQ